VGAAVVAALLVEAAVVFMRVRARVSAPFWYDEQWRAYHLSLTKGFWREPQHINTAVAAGWVGIERASVLAFGNNEWALRLPEVLVLAAIGWPTWRVARHWVGVTASAIIAAAMVASGPLLPYAVQLKPYAIEALCCVVALLLWLEATDPDGHSTPTRIAMYAGIGLCTLVATPLVFAVAPLLAIDLARGLRSRGRGELLRRVGPAALAGGMALAHLIWFVLPQRTSANINTWNLDFLPRSGRLGWVTAHLGTFVPGVVTSGLRPLPGGVDVALEVQLVGGLAAGTAFALLDARARPLLAALYGALAIELVAAALRLWPFGFVRVSLFMVPLFYLLTGFGMARLAGLVAGWARRRHAAAQAGGVAALALVLAASAAGCWGVAWASGTVVSGMHALDQRHHHAWGDGMRTLIEQARGQAGPRDAAIVVGTMGVKGWSYYMWSYQGRSNTWARGPIPPDRTLVGDPPQRSSVTAFLAAHRDAGHVFLMTMINAHRGWEPAIEGPLAAAGYRQVRTSKAAVTGTLTVWERQAFSMRPRPLA
jgi:hypothetical protein